jgi:modulator of FtsH protease HflK
MTQKDNSLDATLDNAWKTLKTPIKAGLAIIGAGILFFSSCYNVPKGSDAVIKTMGKFTGQTSQGLHFKVPIFQSMTLVPVRRTQKIEIGFRTKKSAAKSEYEEGKQFQEEYLNLCGDLTMADVECIVNYDIKSASDYLFNVRNPELLLRDMAVATISEVVGNGSLDEITKIKRNAMDKQILAELQKTMDFYKSGINIKVVQFQKTDVPEQVREAVLAVNGASSERDQKVNEANGVYNGIVNKAEGEMLMYINNARGESINMVNTAQGDIDEYLPRLKTYQQYPAITRTRLLLDARERFYQNTGDKWIIKSGISPLLPLSNFGGEK